MYKIIMSLQCVNQYTLIKELLLDQSLGQVISFSSEIFEESEAGGRVFILFLAMNTLNVQ